MSDQKLNPEVKKTDMYDIHEISIYSFYQILATSPRGPQVTVKSLI